uniref:C2H2-type domain-containing protein n=1 Tax=Anopheles minimus TaxID=112268 RepID=A0A182W3T0_9DIPT
MPTHLSLLPFRCTSCTHEEVIVTTLASLNKHHLMHQKPLKCCVCDKRFTTYGSRRLHEASKHKCDKRFETSIQYHSHKRQHVKRYQCSYCGIRIAQLRDFEDHENTHTGSRPYECRSCGKKFKTASTYYGHRLIHSGEKKHFCTICNKGFLRLRHVQVHMRTHTGEKSFRCEFCGRQYADKQTYNKHKLTHRPTVGDMLRAKENSATTMNAVQEKLMQLEGRFDTPNGEPVFQSEFTFSTDNFTSS